jgi:adenosylcobinamide amidohydrolase
MNAPFAVRADLDALILSFPEPVRVLSWAVLNGRWLEHAATNLGLTGRVVAMATAVEIKNLLRVSMPSGDAEVNCFATVGCGNALSVGDLASIAIDESAPAPLHTINMIITVRPGLSDEAMVEAIQIATEGRVRALYEAGITSSVSSLAATGTGTDCIAVVSLGGNRAPYCGKHTQLGEWIGRAAYNAVKDGLATADDKRSGAGRQI